MFRKPFAMFSESRTVPGLGVVLVLAFRGRPRPKDVLEIRAPLFSLIEDRKPQLLVIDLRSLRGGFRPKLTSILVLAYARLRRLGGARSCRLLGKGGAGQHTEALLRVLQVLPLFGGRVLPDLEAALESVRSDLPLTSGPGGPPAKRPYQVRRHGAKGR